MKSMKKILAVVLTALMIFAMAVPAFAADGKQDIPIIYVKGQGGSIYDADGNELGGYDVDVQSMVSEVLKALVSTYTTRDYRKAADCLGDILSEMFPALDNNGEAAEGEHADPSKFSGKKSNYGYNDYAFVYDWRLDPIYNADLLAEHIDKVLAYTGAEKVALVGFSEGSCVCGAYLTYYGGDKVDSYTMVSPGCNGIDIVGALAAGQCEFDQDVLDKFVSYYVDAGNLMGDDTTEALLSAFASLLTRLRLMGLGTAFLQDLYNGINDNAAFSDVVLGCYPGFWSFVSDEYYDAAIEKNFGGREEQFAGLIEKIDKYHTEVYRTLPDTLTALKDEGMKIYVVAKYGSAPFPVTADSDVQCDGVIELHNTSFGATCAKLGETLEGESQYISPDKVIDASTCQFRDSTWFLKNCVHAASPACMESFVVSLTKYTTQQTVESIGMTQFLEYDSAAGTISAQTSDDSEPVWTSNFLTLIKRFFKNLFAFISNLFNK